MSTVKATFIKGQVVLRTVPDWPEGTEVLVEPVPHEKQLGMREEDWPTDPEGIVQHLALMDQIEPLEMTLAEEAECEAARLARKEFDATKWREKAKETA